MTVVPGRPELRGTVGMVSATHWLASASGMSVLERGGNAFDAAAAAGFVLQVVEPHLNGPGGDVPILFHDARTGTVNVVCGQGPMPSAATAAAVRAEDLDRIPGSGLLPATVPGAFGAWLRLLAEHGTMSVADVLGYAIGYADGGFPLLPKAAEAIATLQPLFTTEWLESGRTYLPGGAAPRPLAPLRNPVLAETYRRILREAKAASTGREAQIEAARDAFYEGFVAEAIDGFVRHTEVLDATGRHRGLLAGADLAAWRPTVEPAVSGEFLGCTVHKPGPWSQGPVFLQQLALLDGFDLAGMGLGSVAYLHTITECAKLAYADREAWYGDPDFTDVPLDILLSERYAGQRRGLVTEHASAGTRPGSPGGLTPWVPAEPPVTTTTLPSWLGQLDSGLPTILPLTEAKGDTCCLAVADRHGNLVVATPSGGWLKSSPVVPGLGFPLGTRGQMTELDAGHPNSLAPGKRPRTTLSPTVVLREGQPWLAFGTPGGDQQDQWTLGFFLAVVLFDLDLQSAAEIPAHHTDHVRSSFTPRRSRPLSLSVDERCGPDVLAGLRARGHDVTANPPFSLGTVCAVGVDRRDGLLRAAAGPRGLQAYAAGR